MILVTGATGRQGGAVISALLALPSSPKIHAFTRNPTSPAALALIDLSPSRITLVKGTFYDHLSLVAALQSPVSAVFFVTDNAVGGAAKELKQGETMVRALKEVGREVHVVYTSVDGAERRTGVPHFEAKFQIEQMLRAFRPETTVLRPVGFMDQFPKRSSLQSFFFFGLYEAVLGGKAVQWVATHDIGHFASLALTDPTKYSSRTIGIAGDDLSIDQVQDLYASLQGFRPWRMPFPSSVTKVFPEEIRLGLEWFQGEEVFNVDIARLRAEYPALLTFRQWLESE